MSSRLLGIPQPRHLNGSENHGTGHVRPFDGVDENPRLRENPVQEYVVVLDLIQFQTQVDDTSQIICGGPSYIPSVDCRLIRRDGGQVCQGRRAVIYDW